MNRASNGMLSAGTSHSTTICLTAAADDAQKIIRSRAGIKSVVIGISLFSLSLQPHFSGKNLSPVPFHYSIW